MDLYQQICILVAKKSQLLKVKRQIISQIIQSARGDKKRVQILEAALGVDCLRENGIFAKFQQELDKKRRQEEFKKKQEQKRAEKQQQENERAKMFKLQEEEAQKKFFEETAARAQQQLEQEKQEKDKLLQEQSRSGFCSTSVSECGSEQKVYAHESNDKKANQEQTSQIQNIKQHQSSPEGKSKLNFSEEKEMASGKAAGSQQQVPCTEDKNIQRSPSLNEQLVEQRQNENCSNTPTFNRNQQQSLITENDLFQLDEQTDQQIYTEDNDNIQQYSQKQTQQSMDSGENQDYIGQHGERVQDRQEQFVGRQKQRLELISEDNELFDQSNSSNSENEQAALNNKINDGNNNTSNQSSYPYSSHLNKLSSSKNNYKQSHLTEGLQKSISQIPDNSAQLQTLPTNNEDDHVQQIQSSISAVISQQSSKLLTEEELEIGNSAPQNMESFNLSNSNALNALSPIQEDKDDFTDSPQEQEEGDAIQMHIEIAQNENIDEPNQADIAMEVENSQQSAEDEQEQQGGAIGQPILQLLTQNQQTNGNLKENIFQETSENLTSILQPTTNSSLINVNQQICEPNIMEESNLKSQRQEDQSISYSNGHTDQQQNSTVVASQNYLSAQEIQQEELSAQQKIELIEQKLFDFIKQGNGNEQTENVLEQALLLRTQMNVKKKDMPISEKWYASFTSKYGIEIE